MAGAWTDERIALLRRYFSEGLRSSQIAERLGGDITRNAVIGKLNRLKLSASGVRAHRQSLDAIVNKRNQHRRKRNETKIARAAAKVVFPREPIPVPRVDDVVRVQFKQLDKTHCRFPINHVGEEGFGFCGLPRVPNSSYCEGHHHRCTRPPQVFVRGQFRVVTGGKAPVLAVDPIGEDA